MATSLAERVLEPTPSRVLLLGAGGFIGSAVLARFNADGVEVRAVARRREPSSLANVEWRALDLATLLEPKDWLPHLQGVDVVVNCAGVLQGPESRAVHVDSARALYAACERAAVLRVVLVSAIGVERGAVSEFSATKAAGELALMSSSLDWVVLRPSVVVGRAAYGGTALLRGLAALPVTLEFPDTGPLQVVQLDDLVATIVALSRPDAPARLTLDVVGPERLPFSVVVGMFRQWLRLPRRSNVGVVKICESVKACKISVGERAVVLRPTVGIRYLAELTNNPGRSISSVALVSNHGDAGLAPRREPVLDDMAKARYRARIGELRAEIDDADLCADLERASRARLEMDELIEQLSRVSGLHGAMRSFVDDRERARVAVRKAITRALDAIGKFDPEIARELEARVVTGSSCMFDATGLARPDGS